jgi:hypothetical protein
MAGKINIAHTKGKARSWAALKGKYSVNHPVFQHLAFDSDGVVTDFDDFNDEAIDARWAVANSSGTAAQNATIALAANGTVTMLPGTTDNGSTSLIGPIKWNGDNNCGMEVRLKVSAITDIHVEVGFVNGVPASNTGAVNDIDTPTVYMTDGAVVAVDTDQTLKTMAFVTVGSTTGQDAAKVNCGTKMFAVDTYMTIAVQLTGNNATCFIDGEQYSAAYDAEGNVEGGTLLGPWIFIQNRGTAARTLTVDYIRVWGDRA